MQLFSGIFLTILVGFAACDFACYRDAMSKCEVEFHKDNKDTSLCKLAVATAQCQIEAAKECDLELEKAARTAFVWTLVYCTEGTTFNNALKNDEHCDINTIADNNQQCTGDLNREMAKITDDTTGVKTMNVLCRFLDSMSTCNRVRFLQCSRESQKALNKVSDSTYDLYREICKIVPSA